MESEFAATQGPVLKDLPGKVEKLIFTQAGFLAQRRLAAGALITTVLQEAIRNGSHSVADLMKIGQHILGRRHVHPSVVGTLTRLQIEGTFKTGTHLITVDQPISTDDGDIKMALYGSFLPAPAKDSFPQLNDSDYGPMKMPGAILPADSGDIVLSPGRKRIELKVGSHFHFMETNPDLDFDRKKAYGFHLDKTAGEFVRFDPDSLKAITLTEIGGLKTIKGGSGFAIGTIDQTRATKFVQRLRKAGYRYTPEVTEVNIDVEPCSMDRWKYALTYGPTVGDYIRLGYTGLWAIIERDHTIYGDECILGDGKTIMDGQGQASGCPDAECLDLAIVNAVVLDWTGICKADIGVKDGVIVGIGKSGNPDTMDGVSSTMVIGSNTDIIDAKGKIITAGGIDTHAHLIRPQQASKAMASGITTMFGGGTGPSTSSQAVNCSISTKYIKQMMQACDQLPINYGIIGKGSDSGKPGLYDQCDAGVVALKLHEDFGCTPSTIDTCLSICEEQDIQCQIHTDSLNESGFVERTIAAFKNRTIHVYHVEGAGGGHEPDVIKLVQEANVLPSSTTPTMPFTTNTIDEHMDMAATCHRLSKSNPDDVSFLDGRIRGKTIAAEDVLHDIGAISIMSSDSQAMGRCGEVILCTWKTAHINKFHRGALFEDKGTGADNQRVKRYISKYTINPALTQEPSDFGLKPCQVTKKGFIAFAQMGDPNAAVSTVEPLIARPMFAVDVVRNCRTVTKHYLKFNNATSGVMVDQKTLW
ncbi:hypothetical protein PENANT_c127G02648 [Penicillium antarcticum]|uniref:urease n=1 Tax=Penicillium antarcticum TaxID=416450 RepID=A0A1V6PGX5_9EURO|nr:hypothetical protein PENANT_c127G02648 [Penicillium antarcticum]